MEWYNYLAAFFAGAFLANAVPHYVKGVCGDKFPSPFARPPGKGLSSPVTNVLWGLFNVVVGYFLVKAGYVGRSNCPALATFFVGATAMSLMLASNFQKKDKE
jgi:hypothetical protein